MIKYKHTFRRVRSAGAGNGMKEGYLIGCHLENEPALFVKEWVDLRPRAPQPPPRLLGRRTMGPAGRVFHNKCCSGEVSRVAIRFCLGLLASASLHTHTHTHIMKSSISALPRVIGWLIWFFDVIDSTFTGHLVTWETGSKQHANVAPVFQKKKNTA